MTVPGFGSVREMVLLGTCSAAVILETWVVAVGETAPLETRVAAYGDTFPLETWSAVPLSFSSLPQHTVLRFLVTLDFSYVLRFSVTLAVDVVVDITFSLRLLFFASLYFFMRFFVRSFCHAIRLIGLFGCTIFLPPV